MKKQFLNYNYGNSNTIFVYLFVLFLSFYYISMVPGESGHIRYFYLMGGIFYFYYLIVYLHNKISINIGKPELFFYTYPALMFLSTLWSINYRITIYYTIIDGFFHSCIFFIVCRINLKLKIQLTLKFSKILSIIGLGTAIILLLKHGSLRGSDINSFGLNIMYVNAVIMPFLLMQYHLKYFNKNSIVEIALCLIAVAITNILTLSRIAIFSLILVPFLYFLLYYGISIKRLFVHMKILFIIICFVFISYSIVPKSFLKTNLDRFNQIYSLVKYFPYLNSNLLNYAQRPDVAELGRLLMYYNAFETIKQNPFLGVGFRNSVEAGQEISGRGIVIHNFFLNSFVELGLFGFILSIFLAIYGFICGLKKLKFIKQYVNELKSYYSAVLTAFIMTIFVSSFQPSFNKWIFYFTFSLILSNDFKLSNRGQEFKR